MSRYASSVATLVIVVCTGYVAFAAVSAPPPPSDRPASAEERVAIAKEIADREQAWKDEAVRGFPSDLWSQRDDFHGLEVRGVFEVKGAHGVRVEDVLKAVDDDLHHGPATSPGDVDWRNARAVPCKPRPVYD
jgi:hypothetical protein